MEAIDPSGEPAVEFQISSIDGVATVTLAGELDIASVDQLEQVVSPLIESEPRRLVVDVGGLRFADSSAIAMWVRWAVAARDFELRDPSPLLRKVISAMGLSGTLRLT